MKNLEKYSIRKLAEFVGVLGACCLSLKYNRVYMKGFEIQKFLALQKNSEK